VRTRLVGLGRAWIQQFTWERTARQTLEVYARVLGHTGEPERPAP
jgi:hypothetical protein